MEQKINIAKLLKDCPKGMELDCVMFENLEFDRIEKDDGSGKYYIICRVKTEIGYNVHTFTEYGCYSSNNYAKCVIFPKGKTTWEEFHRPFKDGDILTSGKGNIFIYKGPMYYNEQLSNFYCGYRVSDGAFIPKLFGDRHFGNVSECRFATEREKQKLFDAIKANGLKWNSETKTLEELVKPKFKVGDKIRHKDDKTVITITEIKDDYYFIRFYNIRKKIYQNEKVLFKYQDNYELIPNKFDLNTLIPFESKVLVRDKESHKWRPATWGYYDEDVCDYHYVVTGGQIYRYCIPYDGNEHLLATNDDCDDYYKTWK